jgi:hypothetical protein
MQDHRGDVINDKPFPGIDFPNWVVVLYGVSSVVLLPWAIYLTDTLPTRYLSHHWDFAWGGFDILIFILLVSTTYMTARKSSGAALTASALGTILIVDAWFDVMTARPGGQQIESIAMAAFVELPLAIISFIIAHWVMVYVHKTLK